MSTTDRRSAKVTGCSAKQVFHWRCGFLPRLCLFEAAMREVIIPARWDFFHSLKNSPCDKHRMVNSDSWKISPSSAQSPFTVYPRLAVSRRSSSTKTVTRVPRRFRTSRKVTVSLKQAADFCSRNLRRLPGSERSAEKVFSKDGQHPGGNHLKAVKWMERFPLEEVESKAKLERK